MFKKTKSLLATSLSVAMLATMVTIPRVASAAASTQLAGKDRYETALKIVEDGWTKSDSVVIARGDDLADALAAAPLAFEKGQAPILLTKTNEIPEGVLDELDELGVKNVYIVGGTGAVSTAVEEELDEDYKVTRIEGKDRVETSLAVAKEAFGTTAPEEVVIANGYAYADALSVSSIAASKGMPIILVNDNKLSAKETAYIAGKTVYAIGGEGVLKETVVEAADATRLAGLDRYETNAAVLTEFKPDYSKIYLAKGTPANLVDSLAGSALAAKGNNPIVLVNENNEINAMQKTVVAADITADSTIYTLGGTVTQKAVDAIEALIKDVVIPPVATELKVKSVSAINDTILSVIFEGKDAVEIPVSALKDGQTVVTFTYETKEYTGTLAEAYVTVATELKEVTAKLLTVYNAKTQLTLYNALNALDIENIKDANIKAYVVALENLKTTVTDVKDFTKVMAQDLVNKVNTATLTAEQQAVIVKAVVDAKNEVALFKALQNPAFERVNAAWIAKYVVLPTTEKSIVGIQDMINTANMVYVNLAVKTGIDKTVLTASKTLITTYATPDAKGAQTTNTIEAINAINIQLAIADVVAATPTDLKAKLNALATLVNPKTGTPILDMTKYVETSGKLYIAKMEGKTTVLLLITAFEEVNEEVNSRVVAEDLSVVNSSFKGYNVGFTLNGAKMNTAKTVVINLYKETTLLATATSSGLLENLPTATTTQQSAPFDVFESFDYEADGNWAYSGWKGAVTDIPTKAEIIVTFNDDVVTTTQTIDKSIEKNLEDVNNATNAGGVNTALLALGDANYLNVPSVDREYVANLVFKARNLQKIVVDETTTEVTQKFVNLVDVRSAVKTAIETRGNVLSGVNALTNVTSSTDAVEALGLVGNETFNGMSPTGQVEIAEKFLNACEFSETAGTLTAPFTTLADISLKMDIN